MNYYQFNIGNYRRDTGHLSLLEHAIYRSLIDTYYLDEGPLCADKAKLMRTHSVRTEDERTAFEMVLSDFFELTDEGYRNRGCDEVLQKIYEKSEKARQSAKKRWKSDAKGMRSHSEGNANASETQCNGNANGMLPNNPLPINPIPNTKTPSKDSAKKPAEPKWSDDDERCAQWCLDEILKSVEGFKKPKNLDKWADTIRLMREQDGRTHKDIARLWQWCRTDPGKGGYSENANVQSMTKLRQRWANLWEKAKASSWSHTTGPPKSAHQQRVESAHRTYDPEINRQMLEGI